MYFCPTTALPSSILSTSIKALSLPILSLSAAMSTDGDDDITSIDMYFFGIAKLCFNKVCGCKKMLSEKKRELAGESREFAGIDRGMRG